MLCAHIGFALVENETTVVRTCHSYYIRRPGAIQGEANADQHLKSGRI